MSAAEAFPQRETVIGDVMSNPVRTVEIGESLWDAWQLLFVSGLRHLVVLNEDGNPSSRKEIRAAANHNLSKVVVYSPYSFAVDLNLDLTGYRCVQIDLTTRHVTVPDYNRLLEEAGDDADGGFFG
mgnify:CR=1 FL=1